MNDGKKKKAQKHKNKTAFKITFDTQALQHVKKVSLNDLCVRCTQQIEWKLQYNKYKKMTEPGKCNFCLNKTVFRTYMKACQPCVEQKQVCAKCLATDYQKPEEVKVSEKDQKKQQQAEYKNQIDFMKMLQERSRRTVRRELEKGKISWDPEQQYFVDAQGNKMALLHFRKGFNDDQNELGNLDDNEDLEGDDNMFGDDDDDDDMDELEGHQTKKQQKQEENKEKDQNKQQGNSDVEGDQVDCENDLDFDDQDFQDEQEQEEQEQPAKKGKNHNKKK